MVFLEKPVVLSGDGQKVYVSTLGGKKGQYRFYQRERDLRVFARLLKKRAVVCGAVAKICRVMVIR